MEDRVTRRIRLLEAMFSTLSDDDIRRALDEMERVDSLPEAERKKHYRDLDRSNRRRMKELLGDPGLLDTVVLMIIFCLAVGVLSIPTGIVLAMRDQLPWGSLWISILNSVVFATPLALALG